MNAPLRPAHDSEPWYRQFWPWFLIALPGTVVIASFFTLWLAIKSPNPLVVDDYSRIARSTERRMERDQAAAALGARAELRFLANAGLVEVRLQPASLVPESLELRLSHPLLEHRDLVVPLARSPDAWSGRLEPLEGRWYLQLYPGDRSWRLSGELAGESELTLQPSADSD